MPGEYLVTVHRGGNEALIRQVYAPYSVTVVQDLGGDLFLLRIEADPGPEAIGEKARESPQIRSVQPNFVYRAR